MAEVPTLSPLIMALIGNHQLLRAQINIYPEGWKRPGHAWHHDGLKSGQAAVVFSVGATVKQQWRRTQHGKRSEAVIMEHGDVVLFNAQTDQEWEHGVKYGAAGGRFRASVVLTVRIAT